MSCFDGELLGRYVNATMPQRDPLRHRLLVPVILDLCCARGLDGRVLEVGCGPGDLLSALVERGAQDLLAIDSSPDAVGRARSLSLPGVRVEQYDVEEPLPSDWHFDVVVASMVLHLIDRLDRVVVSLATALDPGGVLVVALPHPIFHADTAQVRRLSVGDVGSVESLPDAPYDEPRDVWNSFGDPPVKVHMHHRPLATYIEKISSTGLQLIAAREPTFRGAGVVPTCWRRVPPFVFLAFCAERRP